MVRGLVPDPDHRPRPGLAAAVRAAGADAETAARVAAVRERLLARRYGPPGPAAEDTNLIAEVEELVRRLGDSLRGWRGRGAAVALLVGLLCGTTRGAGPPHPRACMRAGALRAAAEGFARRAELEPAVAAHWYDLGATYYRLGAKGRATAAWIQARRLDSAGADHPSRAAAHARTRRDVGSVDLVAPGHRRRAAAAGRARLDRRLDRVGPAPPTAGSVDGPAGVRGGIRGRRLCAQSLVSKAHRHRARSDRAPTRRPTAGRRQSGRSRPVVPCRSCGGIAAGSW